LPPPLRKCEFDEFDVNIKMGGILKFSGFVIILQGVVFSTNILV